MNGLCYPLFCPGGLVVGLTVVMVGLSSPWLCLRNFSLFGLKGALLGASNWLHLPLTCLSNSGLLLASTRGNQNFFLRKGLDLQTSWITVSPSGLECSQTVPLWGTQRSGQGRGLLISGRVEMEHPSCP